jgi:hypothetical protein
MRIWSIHPHYLDPKGLVSLWREALLAQKVLQGKTKGYKNHPQLERFKKSNFPLEFIGSYLECVWREAEKRGYSFDHSKIKTKFAKGSRKKIKVTENQIKFETLHLKQKLRTRSPSFYIQMKKAKKIMIHPLFRQVAGAIESWEVL